VSTDLNVWMNGELVGAWSRTRTGVHRLAYAETWLHSPRRRSLSLSLPIGPSREITGAPVSSYFENLLPDNDNIRRRLGARFRTGGTEAFELLTAIGRDCVGAVQLLPPEMAPEGFDRIDGVPLNAADVERLLRSVTAEPLPGMNDDAEAFRISIATSGRFLPGARGPARQKIRIRRWTRNGRRAETAFRQRLARRGS